MHDVRVEVVYALPDGQTVIALTVPAGTTVQGAVAASGILGEGKDPDIDGCMLGIYGRRVAPGTAVREGDRIEIYRPLIADPKESRRRRAAKRAAR